MRPEFLSSAADNLKSKILPQRGLKRDLNKTVANVVDYFEGARRGGPISELHANGLVIGKLNDGKGHYIEIDVFAPASPWHRDRLTIKGNRVSMRQVGPVESSPRQSLPKPEVERIIYRIQHVTVPYANVVESKNNRRDKAKSLFDRIKDFRGRFPAKELFIHF
jgi:hypothetical protein